MKNILKSQYIKQQRLIYFQFQQQLPQINFGPSKIPKCNFCHAYLSSPIQKAFIKNQGIYTKFQPNQNRVQCNLCGSFTQVANNLPIKINQVPNSYKVQLLSTHQQYNKIQDRLPTFVLLIDRNYPLFDCLKEALLDILEKLDMEYDFIVCVYDKNLVFYDLKGDEIEQVRVNQDSMECIINTISQNNQKFRQNLSVLFDYLKESTNQKYQNIQINKTKKMCSTYNGLKQLQIIHQSLVSFITNSNFFRIKNYKIKFCSFRLIWFQYLSSPVCPEDGLLKHHPKVYTQCFLFKSNKNLQIIQKIANNVENMIILKEQNCIEQLHFTLYQILQSYDNVYYFNAHAKGKVKYSIELAYKYDQIVRKRSIGLILRQRNTKAILSQNKSKPILISNNKDNNIYQISATFYDPLNHKKYLYVSTFTTNNISPNISITLTRFHIIKNALKGHMSKMFYLSKSNTAFTRTKQQQQKTSGPIINLINSIYKDPVKCSYLYKCFKTGDLNGNYILFPIIIKKELSMIIYSYRFVYRNQMKGYGFSNQKFQNNIKKKQQQERQIIEQLNEKSNIYYSIFLSDEICPANLYQLIKNQENIFSNCHFSDQNNINYQKTHHRNPQIYQNQYQRQQNQTQYHLIEKKQNSKNYIKMSF